MIRKILWLPLKILEVFFFIFAVIAFIGLGITDRLQKKRGINPIRYSKDGKVVSLNDFRADKTRGEL